MEITHSQDEQPAKWQSASEQPLKTYIDVVEKGSAKKGNLVDGCHHDHITRPCKPLKLLDGLDAWICTLSVAANITAI
jgi:hypothetical protein